MLKILQDLQEFHINYILSMLWDKDSHEQLHLSKNSCNMYI